MDGDDAADFIEDFSREYDVNIENFIFDRCFGDEVGFNPLFYFFCRIFNKDKIEKQPLSIEDLILAAKNKILY